MTILPKKAIPPHHTRSVSSPTTSHYSKIDKATPTPKKSKKKSLQYVQEHKNSETVELIK
jgi:hypothetical protein